MDDKVAMDEKFDQSKGIKEDSPRDRAIDRKRGISEASERKPKGRRM